MLVGEIEKDSLKVEFVQIDEREFEEVEIDVTDLTSTEDIITKIEELYLTEENFYKVILTGKRFFKIDLEEINKVLDIENIIKIKDTTKMGVDIEKIKEENNIRGKFVRNMLDKQINEDLDKEFIEKAIEIGLEVL